MVGAGPAYWAPRARNRAVDSPEHDCHPCPGIESGHQPKLDQALLDPEEFTGVGNSEHDVTQERIVAALVHGTTPPQAAGMLIAFNRYEASRRRGAAESVREPEQQESVDG
jgi:hypothetical protein